MPVGTSILKTSGFYEKLRHFDLSASPQSVFQSSFGEIDRSGTIAALLAQFVRQFGRPRSFPSHAEGRGSDKHGTPAL
jgi:hypothetical protein